MSKKVLIIRSTVVRKDSKLFRDAEALASSIMNCGIAMLPSEYTYEFGEIDGVIWEGPEKKEAKKPDADWDAIFTELENLERDAYIDYDNYKSGWNDALEHAKRVIEQYKEKEENK